MIWEEDSPWDVVQDAYYISLEACGIHQKVKDYMVESCYSKKELQYWEVLSIFYKINRQLWFMGRSLLDF
jgi:hypothetical protein